ncbi:MAG TPA: hypothetical protein DCP63_00730 [Bacteroidetes bacterium]|nr:hypothetical protein [Bacteroidota bacterium]
MMKHARGVLVVLVILMAGALFAAEGKKYGKPLTLKKSVKISEILATPENFNGKKVLVEGPIVDVCKMRGCWIKIGSEKEFESIQFKVEDGVIIFPAEAKGRHATAEGVVSVKTFTKEDLIEQGTKHAKEEGMEFDSSTVKGPKTIVIINGEGAVIK